VWCVTVWRPIRDKPVDRQTCGMPEPRSHPAGIRGSALPGPYAVGHHAAKLCEYLRERSRVQHYCEVWTLRVSRARI
jgi:hypothetical protein